jgi:hypothetical protein
LIEDVVIGQEPKIVADPQNEIAEGPEVIEKLAADPDALHRSRSSCACVRLMSYRQFLVTAGAGQAAAVVG